MATDNKDNDQFALSVSVTSIEKPSDYKKDTNFICKITVETTHGKWNLNRSFKDFEIFHANLVINDSFRGLNFPKIPARKGSVPSIDDYLFAKKNEYTTYLSEILHRSILLGHKDILDFIQAPEKVRRAAKNIYQIENIPQKSGQMKKEGEKWKGYRLRFFVLLPNYLLQYYETADAYQIGIQPKGCIDLTLATKILVYDKTSNPFSMGIKTPTRIWKLQCDTENERDEWVQSLRNLLQNPKYNGYILDLNDYKMDKFKQNKVNATTTSAAAAATTTNTTASDPIKMKKELAAQTLAMEQQDAQILELQNKLKELISKQNLQTAQLKDEIAIEYKQQLDIQKETMSSWREKVQGLSTELAKIESERIDADNEYKLKINELKQKNADNLDKLLKLKKIIETQKKSINDKDNIISKTQKDVSEMGKAINLLQKDANDRKNKMYSISNNLFKIQGDAVNKLKYNKMSKKKLIFINKINHLFYYDINPNNSKGDQKYIIVKDISTNDNSIQKQMNKPWFKIIGEKRIAVFGSDTKEINTKWVNFIKQSLGKPTNNSNNNNDDDQKDNQ